MTRTAEDTRIQREAALWLSLIEAGESSEADTARFCRAEIIRPSGTLTIR